ncbi:bromodomain containing protein, putative [Babesia ovis]|uniref:Bromodomain containing protein, putative n=1 Tax=Babesia ovis TaxID=5869 RepID=A0A9W5TDV9_BABOV|nr:bromodomain containing protein, putative [Babesia ovis]
MEPGKTWRQFCVLQILKKMRADRYGTLFANPVLEACDSIITPAVKESYRATIPHPMDYKTVKHKLDTCVYQTPEEFRDDMLLIYDNCMKFNPPIGLNKWIYDAAESNKVKFQKLWDASQDKLARLLEKGQNLDNPVLVDRNGNEANQGDCSAMLITGHSVVTSQSFSESQSLVESVSDVKSSTEQVMHSTHDIFEPKEGDNHAADDATHLAKQDSSIQDYVAKKTEPPVKVKLRLSLQAIQEYKARMQLMPKVEALAQQMGFEPPPPEVLDPSMIFRQPSIPEPTSQSLPTPAVDTTDPHQADHDFKHSDSVHTDNSLEIPADPGLTNDTTIAKDLSGAGDMDIDDADTVVDSDVYDHLPIATRREDGLIRTSWLAENECNQLFPHCSIIGLYQRKIRYNVSDIALRSIYNELYLSGTSEPKCCPSDDLLETSVKEDYTLKQHNLITFLLQKPVEPTPASPCSLPEFGDSDTTSTADDERWVVSPFYQETVRDSSDSFGSTNSEYTDDAPLLKPQTLRIEVSSEATFGVAQSTERMLIKTGFSKVPQAKCLVRCTPEIAFVSDNCGYYKTEESAFLYGNTLMRHIRLYLVNCGSAFVEITRKTLPLAELVFKHGVNSAVYDLYLDSKRHKNRSLGFFNLHQAGNISYSASTTLSDGMSPVGTSGDIENVLLSVKSVGTISRVISSCFVRAVKPRPTIMLITSFHRSCPKYTARPRRGDIQGAACLLSLRISDSLLSLWWCTFLYCLVRLIYVLDFFAPRSSELLFDSARPDDDDVLRDTDRGTIDASTAHNTFGAPIRSKNSVDHRTALSKSSWVIRDTPSLQTLAFSQNTFSTNSAE